MNEDSVSKAIHLYNSKQISVSKAAELFGMTLNDFINLLNKNNIPAVEYTIEHLEQDIASVEELFKKKEVIFMTKELKEKVLKRAEQISELSKAPSPFIPGSVYKDYSIDKKRWLNSNDSYLQQIKGLINDLKCK